MNEKEKKTIEKIERQILIGECEKAIGIPVYISDLKIALNLLKKKDVEIHCLEEEKQNAWEEWNNIEQSSYEEKEKLKTEIEKKDKIIDEMAKYIDFDKMDFQCSTLCVKENCKEECIKEYFERKVEE